MTMPQRKRRQKLPQDVAPWQGVGGRERGAVSLGDSSLLGRWARSRRTMRLDQLGTDDPVTLGKSFSLSESQFPLVHIGGEHWIIIY